MMREWEEMSRGRMERLIRDIVARVRMSADTMEREAKFDLGHAAAVERTQEWHTYPRVVAIMITEMQGLLFNMQLSALIDAATETEAARAEKRTVKP